MLNATKPPSSIVTDPLQLLQVLRSIICVAQIVSLGLGFAYLQHAQLQILLTLILCQFMLIAATQWHIARISITQRRPNEKSMFVHLLADCLLLTAVLYEAGGATNPFVSYYLVPIALTAATLSIRATALLTTLCLLAYTLLMFYFEPLQVLSPHAEHMHAHSNGLYGLGTHIFGMWISFGMSAILITYFVVMMASTVRRQREHINQLREQQLMDENIISVAILAAGTAHELGTPLSSLAVMLGDLQHEHPHHSPLGNDVALMLSQVERCQHTLLQLSDTARRHQDGASESKTVRDYLDHLLERWQVLRPDAHAEFLFLSSTAPLCVFPLTLEQAIINLLDNAADASAHTLSVRFSWDDTTLHIDIDDDGPGIAADIVQQVGKLQPGRNADNNSGMGLGLMLSHATLERCGGQLRLQARPGGGTHTSIVIPLHAGNAT